MCLCHFLFSPFSQNTIAAKGKQSKEGIRNGFDDRRSKRPALMMHNHSLCASIDERTLLKSTNSTGLRRGAALCAVVLTTSVCVEDNGPRGYLETRGADPFAAGSISPPRPLFAVSRP